MAGKVSEAETAVNEARRWLPDDDDRRQYFAWLNQTFGFDPPPEPR
jgi:hypothetical protein